GEPRLPAEADTLSSAEAGRLCIGWTRRIRAVFRRVVRDIAIRLTSYPCSNDDMQRVGWSGQAPPRRVVERLAAAGFRIERPDADETPLVVATATAAKVPAPRAERGRWVWVAAEAVPARRAADAVLRGAYDAVSLTARAAADTFAARL